VGVGPHAGCTLPSCGMRRCGTASRPLQGCAVPMEAMEALEVRLAAVPREALLCRASRGMRRLRGGAGGGPSSSPPGIISIMLEPWEANTGTVEKCRPAGRGGTSGASS